MLEVSGKEIRVEGRLIRIAHLDGEWYQFVDDPNGAIAVLGDVRPRVDLFTFIQKLSDPAPRYGYCLEWENMAALRISTYENWHTQEINSYVRKAIRKSKRRGVTVNEVPFNDALIEGISRIYNETPIRQGRRFWHYRKDLESLRKMKATFLDRSIFLGAFFEDKLIGFAKIVTNEDGGQAGFMHILSMSQHGDKAPTNALIAQAVRSCAERRIPYLFYGNFSYGKNKHDGLSEFKHRNGFQKIDVPRYYVPLTMAGRAALALGFHHRVVERIPEPVAATYRKIRSRWYALRFPGIENA